MKIKLICSFALIALAMSSCNRSDDETNTNEEPQKELFNLKVGSEWVYKTYDRKDYTSEFKFNGTIDTVKVESLTSINNKSFVRVKIKSTSSTGQSTTVYLYERVNAKGHLVALNQYQIDNGYTEDQHESVIHPGIDMNYSMSQNIAPYGVAQYKLDKDKTIEVDGKTYTVKPYNGVFTPNNNYPNIPSKKTENLYASGIGKIKSYCHAVNGNYNYEERLTYYNLK